VALRITPPEKLRPDAVPVATNRQRLTMAFSGDSAQGAGHATPRRSRGRAGDFSVKGDQPRFLLN
jgi:hypothetical protein